MPFYRTWRFWEAVLASTLSVAVVWLLGQLLRPLRAGVVAMGWDGFSAWFANLGWFLFVASWTAWLVWRRPLTTFASSEPKASHSASALGPITQSGGLVIHSAEYGLDIPGHEIDATEAVRRSIRNNRIDLEVKNEVMGGDPAQGQRKRLRAAYSFRGGPQQVVEITEKDRLQIP